MAGVHPAVRVVRHVYVVLIGLFVLAILAQAYLAGRVVFGAEAASTDAEESTHAALGWPLAHMFAPLVLLASFFTWGGWRFAATSIAWGLAAFGLPVLAEMALEDGNSSAGAFHPPLAVLLFGLSLWLTWKGYQLAMERPAPAPAAPSAARPPGPVRP